MAQGLQISKPQRLVLDAGRKYLPPDAAFYALNNNTKNKNASGKSTPFPANYKACDLDKPAGESYRIGGGYFDITNEEYAFVYNANGIHWISRINGDGVCEIVDYNRAGSMCYNFSAAPRYEIKAQSRVDLIIEKSNCANRHGKYLIWCDGYNENIGFLDVDACIATDGFTTPFFDRCNNDPCDFRRLCVPQPCFPLTAEWEPLPEEQIGWTNNMLDVAFKLMFKYEYYDGRMSEWSDSSIPYYQSTKGCFDAAGNSFSRCLRTRVPVGNTMVSRIHIAYNKSEFDEFGNNIWYKAEVVEKYKKYNNTQQYWYQRDLAELTNYSDEDCSFDYLFCNDKQCNVVDPKEVSRVYNPIPRYPQGFITIKEAKAFYNYVIGNCPIAQSEVEKFKISTVYPNIVECKDELATVTVRAIIYNDVYHRNQFIYRLGGTAENLPDDETEPAYFGGLKNVPATFELLTTFGQTFSGGVRNFIAYVEGMEVWGEMEQKFADVFFNNPRQFGVASGMDETSIRAGASGVTTAGNFFYQEVKLKVRKGSRGFIRLTSHRSEINEDDKSTFVTGLIDIRNYAGYEHLTITNTNEELYFDTCEGDVELFEAFVIKDNAITNTIAFNGYVRDAHGRAVEGAIIVPVPDGSPSVADQCITDHNGFYHVKVTSASSTSIGLQVKVEQDCSSFATIQTDTVEGAVGASTEHNITIESETWKDDFYTTVTQQVNDCSGNGVGGVRVALSGSKYDVTDANGLASFRIRNYSTRDRALRSAVIDYRGCFNLNCTSECNPCLPTSTGTAPVCFISESTVTLSTVTINTVNALISSRGLKAGGNYIPAFILESACGNKISAAYELPAIRIKKTQEKGNLSFPTFTYDATGMVLPFDGCLKLLFSANTNDYQLQWIVDKIEHVTDNKIKLTIQSLNDYNNKYFFKTNTIYQWLKNDRVEFITNGDGSPLLSGTFGLLNYLTLSPFHDELISGEEDAPADFFNQLLIEDDGRLDTITEGAIIEIQRQKTCEVEPTFYARGISIPVVNGRLLYPTGSFTVFDTYFVRRTLTYEKDSRTVVLPLLTFEHHSPNDFWGDHISDIGKAYFANKFENEKRLEKSISVGSPTQFNYFGDIVKEFDVRSGIVSMNIKDAKVILAILETDTFIAQTADELVRVGGDGIIRALPADAVISEAQPKLRGEYGCSYEDIGSIYYGDGYAFFANGKSGNYIIHDYNQAQIAGLYKDESGRIVTSIKSYTSRRFQEMAASNKNETNYLKHYRFIIGYNSEDKTLYTTIKRLRDNAVNNEKAPYLKKNETIIYDPETDEFLTFHSATPEGYGNLVLHNESGCAMVMYFNAIPYIVTIIPDKYNEFFGVACDWMVGIALNKSKEMVKVPVSLEVQSTQMFFVPEVTTEKNNFRSEIPPVRMKLNESKYHAAFLNNINSRGGLYNGQAARDYSVSVLIMRDNTDALKYLSISNIKRVEYGELDFITIKFIASLPVLQEN